MADYNLLVDKLNTDAERIEITNEVAELKTQNESESRDVDSIFAEKQGRLNRGCVFTFILYNCYILAALVSIMILFTGRSSQIERLEREIEEERHMADNLVSAMQPGLRDRYLELKNQNVQYQKDLEDMNQALDALNSKKAMYVKYSPLISTFN